MQIKGLKFFFLETGILDLSSKNGESSSILEPKEKETSVMQLQMLFYVKQIQVWNFQQKNVSGNFLF